MSGLDSLAGLAGRWTGNNRVWLPDEAPHESDATGVVTQVVGGKFVQLAYTWAFDGAAQEGILLVGHETTEQLASAVWLDSWHMGDKFMICRGQVEANGATILHGSYAVESGPEWGWRIVIEPARAAFRMAMYNVMPDGVEILGVEIAFTKVV